MSRMVRLPSRIPLFPLPSVVLFPASVLPLHIFEPRYRKMVRDVLDGVPMIAMALLKPGWEPDYDGAPDVFRVGCVGKIEKAQKLDDGRFNLALAGVCRVQFKHFYQDLPYRQAAVETLPDIPADIAYGRSPTRQRQEDELRLLASFSSLHRALGSGSAEPAMAINPGIPFDVLVNSLCLHSEVDPYEKQKLLEMPDARQRCLGLTRLLDLRLADAIAKGDVAATPPEGTAIN